MLNKYRLHLLVGALTAGWAATASAQFQGPSTGSTPYVLPTVPGYETTSVLTTDNTGANPDDVVPKVGGGTYGFDGIPDGLGAFDNGDGTFTLLVNHEISSGGGVPRAHGGAGAYVSALVINKNTFAVVSGEDLIKTVYGWNTGTQSTGAPLVNPIFYRFCSADLAAPGAFYNPLTGLGSTARIYLNGEEDSTHGWAMAHVATGVSKGNSYVLGKFNLTTNGSGLTGVGDWETLVANPLPQDKTVVIGNNDGGTGIMNNSVAVYVGTKNSTGATEADKAGLTNGTLKFVSVTGNPVEVVSSSTRATNITNGTRFSLSATTSTTFSRPEDGAWNPKNLNQYYFVTTDVLDSINDGVGAAKGQTRLWRLTFDDVTNPDAGGIIDLLIDGRIVNGEKINMFDNIAVNEKTGRIVIQEDVGNAAHNGKVWEYDPATDTLTKILQHDPARFGGIGVAATAPFNQDEETSGIIDISTIMATSSQNRGYTGEAWYISSDQAHYTSGITASQVEGGQLFVVHDISKANSVAVARGGLVRDRRTGLYTQVLTVTNNTGAGLSSPLDLVLDALSANATVANPSGATVNNPPAGSPYVTIPVGPLAAGASASVTVTFSNPTNAAINYTTRVLSGVATP